MIDYMIMEAVALKVKKQDQEIQKKAEDEAKRREFKADTSELDKYR